MNGVLSILCCATLVLSTEGSNKSKNVSSSSQSIKSSSKNVKSLRCLWQNCNWNVIWRFLFWQICFSVAVFVKVFFSATSEQNRFLKRTCCVCPVYSTSPPLSWKAEDNFVVVKNEGLVNRLNYILKYSQSDCSSFYGWQDYILFTN